MKKSLNKRIRNYLLIAGIIILLAGIVALINEIINPGFKNEAYPLYKYNIKTGISHKVFLKQNSLYEQKVMDESQFIINKYIDYIGITFDYAYEGDQKSHITGDYEIYALLEGYFLEEDKEIIVWRKKFYLQTKAGFEEKDSLKFNVNKWVNINLEKYNEFYQMIAQETKINGHARLTVLMDVNIKAETEKGTIQESLSPKLVIPVNMDYFKLNQNITEEKPGSIEETRQVQIPVNYIKIYSFAAGLVLLICFLSYILFFTRGAEPDKDNKVLSQIFKKHGDRMVALKSIIPDTYQYKFEVKSIEDLIRISDEINKPVLYQYKDKLNISTFYVINGKELYILDIDNITNIEDLEDMEYSETTKELIKSLDINKKTSLAK